MASVKNQIGKPKKKPAPKKPAVTTLEGKPKKKKPVSKSKKGVVTSYV